MDGSGGSTAFPGWLAFTLGGAAGLAALLRGGKRLGWRVVAASVLYNGLGALAVAWATEGKLSGDPAVVGAMCIAAGVGGASVLDVLVAGLRATLGGRP